MIKSWNVEDFLENHVALPDVFQQDFILRHDVVQDYDLRASGGQVGQDYIMSL